MSRDGRYNVTTSLLRVDVEDNDFAGVMAAPAAVAVTEGGATASYTVRLNAAPALAAATNESWVHVAVVPQPGHCAPTDGQLPLYNTSCTIDADCRPAQQCRGGSKVVVVVGVVVVVVVFVKVFVVVVIPNNDVWWRWAMM